MSKAFLLGTVASFLVFLVLLILGSPWASHQITGLPFLGEQEARTNVPTILSTPVPGETRSPSIEVAPSGASISEQSSAAIYIQVCSSIDRQPIPAASLSTGPERDLRIIGIADQSGIISLSPDPSGGPLFGPTTIVEAEGFSYVVLHGFSPEGGPGPHIVTMDPVSELIVTATGTGTQNVSDLAVVVRMVAAERGALDPVDPSTIHLTIDSLGRPQIGDPSTRISWTNRTDDRGRAVFSDLPAGRLLQVVVNAAVPLDAGVLLLEPAESRDFTVSLPQTSDLQGHVLAADTEAPLAGYVLNAHWFGLASQADIGAKTYHFLKEPPNRSVVTGGLGDFLFPDLPLGVWYLGIAAEETTSTRPILERPEPTLFRVTNTGYDHDEILKVQRGLFVGGIVLGPDGNPISGVSLNFFPNDAGETSLETLSGDDGSFLIGPVPSGSGQLVASSPDSYFPRPPQIVAAGDLGIILNLEPSGSIVISLLDDQQDPVQITTVIGSRDGRICFMESRVPGENVVPYLLDGLSQDPIDLFVLGDNDLAGLQPAAQPSLGSTALTIQARPKCMIRISNKSDSSTFASLECQSILVFQESLLPGESRLVSAFPGHLGFRAESGERVDQDDILVVPGGEADFVID